MSEEEYTQVKISMPLIDDIELQRIDTFYNDIVEEYTKAFVKEKEQVIVQRLMKNLQQENSQLNELLEKQKENNIKKYGEILNLRGENLQLKRRIEKAIEYYEIIDNRNTYVEISELRHLINLLKGEKDERI